MTYQTMKQRLPGALAVLVAGLLATGCARGEAGTSDDVSDVEQVGARVVNVEVTPVALEEFTGFIRVTGEVEALNDITVAAEETGRVLSFMAEKGQRVRQGQAIAKLEDDFLTAQVGEAQAAAQLAQEPSSCTCSGNISRISPPHAWRNCSRGWNGP